MSTGEVPARGTVEISGVHGSGNWISNLQGLRALAVLAVVFRHLQIYMERAKGGSPIPGLFPVGNMGVDLFFVISGCVLVVGSTEFAGATGHWKDAVRFLWRRATRIYPLYWLYSLLALAIYLWRPEWLHRLGGGMSVDVVKSFLLWPQAGWPLLGQGWTLVYQMYFYLGFAGLLCLPRRWFVRGLFCWAAAILAGRCLLGWQPTLVRPGTLLLCTELSAEFIVGVLAGLTFNRTRGRQPVAWGMLSIVAGMAWVVVVLLRSGLPVNDEGRVVAFGVPSIAFVCGAIILDRAGWRLPRWLMRIGDWSYSIYLAHIFVIAALFRLVPASTKFSWPVEFLLDAGVSVSVLLVGALGRRYLEAPLSWGIRQVRRPQSRQMLHAAITRWSTRRT